MPRKSRIDAPGALHHIIAYGLDRDGIFRDDADRDGFIARLAAILVETQTPCLAWALLDDRFHLLLKTGNRPLSLVMRRLLTGHAIALNRRHRRQGKVFRDRFRSVLCQEDTYLTELVRYIHLNPLRAGLVADLDALDRVLHVTPRAVVRTLGVGARLADELSLHFPPLV